MIKGKYFKAVSEKSYELKPTVEDFDTNSGCFVDSKKREKIKIFYLVDNTVWTKWKLI
jgi:hypothetical protein